MCPNTMMVLAVSISRGAPVGSLGGAFSAGLTFLFKRPSCLQDTYLFELEPVSTASAATDLKAAPHHGTPCTKPHAACAAKKRGARVKPDHCREAQR